MIEIPSYCVIHFRDEKSWRKEVTRMGAFILETNLCFENQDGCLTAATDDGAIGMFYIGGCGHLIDFKKGYH